MRHCVLIILAIASVAAGATAKAPKDAWTVTRTADPITGVSSCVVSAPDQYGRRKYSRFGFLYPVVENNSQLGLLVGVSSGGQIRLPAGDILWRVDSLPFRQLKAVDNPVGMPTYSLPSPVPTGNPAADKAAADAIAGAMRATTAMISTSTVASGQAAQEMVREMVMGRSLLYRQALAAPAYGLPSSTTYAVGQVTNEGQRPIPIDHSFRAGLAACGIDPTRPAAE